MDRIIIIALVVNHVQLDETEGERERKERERGAHFNRAKMNKPVWFGCSPREFNKIRCNRRQAIGSKPRKIVKTVA